MWLTGTLDINTCSSWSPELIKAHYQFWAGKCSSRFRWAPFPQKWPQAVGQWLSEWAKESTPPFVQGLSLPGHWKGTRKATPYAEPRFKFASKKRGCFCLPLGGNSSSILGRQFSLLGSILTWNVRSLCPAGPFQGSKLWNCKNISTQRCGLQEDHCSKA